MIGSIVKPACSLHFINSVGHSVKDEKNAARNPAEAFPSVLMSFTFDLFSKFVATNFWQNPYAGNDKKLITFQTHAV